MPYKLRSDHPDCSGTAVVRSDTGALVKCHPDRSKALAHLRALYANTDATAPPELAAAVDAAFDPAERRGPDGKWTSTGVQGALRLPGARRLDDGSQPGRAVIAFGDPATARHVVTYVPGVGDDRGLPGEARRALAEKTAADAQRNGDTAAIFWQGYPRPDSIPAALSRAPADAGAGDLAAFEQHLRTINPHAHQTVIGHSYGSVVAGEAASKHGMRPDDLVFVGSPGTTVRTAADLGMPAGHVWAGAHPQDPVARLAPILSEDFHGSPTAPGYGARTFTAGTPGVEFPGVLHGAAHSSYFDPASQALPNMAAIAAARYGNVTAGRPAPVVIATRAQAETLLATAAGYVPGGPRPIVIENHPGCPASQPHGLVNGDDGHLLACHATPEEARAIAEKLDLADPSGEGDSATAAARGGFDPAKHLRVPAGRRGGGEFAHTPGDGLGKLTFPRDLRDNPADPPPSAALKMAGRFTLADAKPGDPLLAKADAKLTHPQMGAGPNKGKIRRPAVPPYKESVARVQAAMTQMIAQQGTLEDGRKWYPDEHEMNHRRALAYHVPIETAIGVEAATCPRVQWAVNQRVTNELLDEVPKVGREAEEIKRAHHFGGGVMASFRDDGVDIILGGGTNVGKVLGGTKRRNFYNNIMWPGQTDSVTVDTWMLQALKPLGLNDQQAMSLGQQAQAGLADGLGKIIVADALRQAAAGYRAQGTDITPDGVQAAAWIAIQKSLGLSDPTAHTGQLAEHYMQAAVLAAVQADPDDEGDQLTDDEWDAELILQYLEWQAEKVPGGVDLGSPGSARPQGGLAADNPAAWKLALANPRFGRLGMTADQARQAAGGPGPHAAAKPGGPYIVRENHPACPAHSPHGVVHSGTGELAGCRPGKAQAQTLALTLNFPDATPVTPGAVMQVGAAGPDVAGRDYVRDEHGRFAHTPGGAPRTRPRAPGQAPRQPATAPGPRRMGNTRPVPPPGTDAQGNAATAVAGSMAAADLSRLISEQVAAATSQLTTEQHQRLAEVKSELERSQAELNKFHKTELTEERKAEEKRKTIRKLIHHVLALAAVAALTFIGVKTGTVDNPMIAGLAATGPLFIQEALDAIKRV